MTVSNEETGGAAVSAGDRLTQIAARLARFAEVEDPETGYMTLTRLGLDGPEADLYSHAYSDLAYLIDRLQAIEGTEHAEEQWCVMLSRLPDEPHRGPMSEEAAREWVREVEADGARAGAFYVARRWVGAWQPGEPRSTAP